MEEKNFSSYEELFRWSVNERESFWDVVVRKLGIAFDTPFSRIADFSKGVESPRWFPDATLNISKSCFSHSKDSPAILYQQEGGSITTITLGELDELSNRVANGLFDVGFVSGDAIAIDMIMTVEAVAMYLGIVKAGMAAVGIADSFAPNEIATRLRIGKVKGVLTQDVVRRGGKELPMYAKIIEANAPRTIVVPADGKNISCTLRHGDLSWKDFLSTKKNFKTISCDPDVVTNILFSSGTTGDPKAIPWTHTTPIKCAVDAYLHHDIHSGDVIAWPTSLGWMMGPWLIYASLMNRATMALYYGAPTGKEFCAFVQNAKVTMLGVVPSLVKAWRNGKHCDGVNWNAIKAFSSTGECSNADDMTWLMNQAGNKPIIEYCGGTEIGGGYITSTVVQQNIPSTFSTPALGLDLVILDEKGNSTDHGELFLIPPSIGLSTTLLNRDHHEVYYEGTPTGQHGELLRRHGDQMERLPNGYYRAHGRADDTMNLGGIKVSSAEIERVLNTVDGVHETAAIAVNPEGGGPSLLVIYAVLTQKNITKEKLLLAMQQKIKTDLNPLFRISDAVVVETLPRTASNKVMRRVLRDQYETT